MGKETKKWICGEKNGFSLVELIIVIAIMAMLTGVVALAVLPYLEKSRETKDLATLDVLCSAMVTAVATTGNLETTAQTFKFDGMTNPGAGTGMAKVSDAMSSLLGNDQISLKSHSLQKTGTAIYCSYDVINNKMYVFAGTDESTALNFTRIRSGYQDSSIPPVMDFDGKAAVVSANGKGS